MIVLLECVNIHNVLKAQFMIILGVVMYKYISFETCGSISSHFQYERSSHLKDVTSIVTVRDICLLVMYVYYCTCMASPYADIDFSVLEQCVLAFKLVQK